uniref:Uncharacterized protein n=1 Tax=Tanacetum cinerariifolium TaxID=118510 RepID=A0A6L2NJH0_TANCI|nr:hypothetical protein [Tanacetum cinerariifolium]
MEDQPLPADASPTALSLDYVVYSDPEKDEKDPKEDPADYPTDRGNNDDDESSNDDDDDDVEKDEGDKEEEEHLAPADPSDVSTDDLDEEDKEEEEHLAPADPSDVSTDDLETMTTVNQGMSIEEIERVVAQRVANAIEATAIHETKTNIALKSMSQTDKQEEKVAENASNKRKMRASKPKTMQDAIEIATKLRNKKISTLVECQTKNKTRLDNTPKNNQNQQQPNKRQNTGRAYTARHGEKKL